MKQGTAAVIGRLALRRVRVGPRPLAPRDVAGPAPRPSSARRRSQDDGPRAAPTALEAVMAYLAGA